MAEKLTFTIDEIAAQVGVSVKTVRRRIKSIQDYLSKDQRKRFYSPTEKDLVISLFHDEVKGL